MNGLLKITPFALTTANDIVFTKASEVFAIVIDYLVLLIEFVGVAVLVMAVVKAVVELVRKKEFARLHLAEGIALSLEFKMGGELLRTVIVRDWNEILILGAVILLRSALAFLIQWEIKIERKNHEKPLEAPKDVEGKEPNNIENKAPKE